MTLNENHADALRAAAQKVDEAKAAFEQAKQDREHVIQSVALDGASYREIAKEAGLSYQRVHQLLTGEKNPPKMPYGIDSAYHCPKCGARPRQSCKDENGKDRGATHIERSHRALYVRLEGTQEPREDEPGPLTPIFSALEAYMGGRTVVRALQARGPVYLNPDDAAAHARTFGEGARVGQWIANKWEPIG